MSSIPALPPDAEARLAMLNELHERTRGNDNPERGEAPAPVRNPQVHLRG